MDSPKGRMPLRPAIGQDSPGSAAVFDFLNSLSPIKPIPTFHVTTHNDMSANTQSPPPPRFRSPLSRPIPRRPQLSRAALAAKKLAAAGLVGEASWDQGNDKSPDNVLLEGDVAVGGSGPSSSITVFPASARKQSRLASYLKCTEGSVVSLSESEDASRSQVTSTAESPVKLEEPCSPGAPQEGSSKDTDVFSFRPANPVQEGGSTLGGHKGGKETRVTSNEPLDLDKVQEVKVEERSSSPSNDMLILRAEEALGLDKTALPGPSESLDVLNEKPAESEKRRRCLNFEQSGVRKGASRTQRKRIPDGPQPEAEPDTFAFRKRRSFGQVDAPRLPTLIDSPSKIQMPARKEVLVKAEPELLEKTSPAGAVKLVLEAGRICKFSSKENHWDAVAARLDPNKNPLLEKSARRHSIGGLPLEVSANDSEESRRHSISGAEDYKLSSFKLSGQHLAESAPSPEASRRGSLIGAPTPGLAEGPRMQAGSPDSPHGKKRKKGDGSCKGCHCKKSLCLKLYCECFASGVYCTGCTCENCQNTPEFATTVAERREEILAKDPMAFTPKIIDKGSPTFPEESFDTPGVSGRHKKGCNCKKSMCTKKYCECFQAGVGCSAGCRCENCLNTFGRKDGSPKPTVQELEAEAAEEPGLALDYKQQHEPLTPGFGKINVKRSLPGNGKLVSSRKAPPESPGPPPFSPPFQRPRPRKRSFSPMLTSAHLGTATPSPYQTGARLSFSPQRLSLEPSDFAMSASDVILEIEEPEEDLDETAQFLSIPPSPGKPETEPTKPRSTPPRPMATPPRQPRSSPLRSGKFSIGANPRSLGTDPRPLGGSSRPLGATPRPLVAAPRTLGATPRDTPKPLGGATPRPLGADPEILGTTPRPLGDTPRALGGTPRQVAQFGNWPENRSVLLPGQVKLTSKRGSPKRGLAEPVVLSKKGSPNKITAFPMGMDEEAPLRSAPTKRTLSLSMLPPLPKLQTPVMVKAEQVAHRI